MQEIPIDAVKNQRFDVVLKEKTYTVYITYNEDFGYFQISINLGDEVVIANRKATFDRNILIEAFGLGSLLGLYNVGDVIDPTFNDFGDGVKLLYEE